MAIDHKRKRIVAWIVTLCLVPLAAIGFSQLEGIQEIENRTWDWRVKLTWQSSQADPRIRIIEVDQRSLDEQASEGVTWPWPRDRYSDIIRFLELGGARGLAFDILFTEESSYGAEDDKQFASAMTAKLPVLHIAALSGSEREIDEDRFEILARKLHEQDQRTGFTTWYKDNHAHLPVPFSYNSILLPVEGLLKAGGSFGNSSADPDSDGVLRHYSAGGDVRGLVVLNSPFAFFDLTGGDLKSIDLKSRMDSRGRLAVRFKSAGQSYRPVSADAIIKSYAQVKRGEIPYISPEEFKDRLVYIGLTAPGLFDLKPTPINGRGKAVEFLANVLDNILNDDFVTYTTPLFNYLMAVIFTLFVTTAIFLGSRLRSQSALIVIAILALLLFQYYTAAYGYRVSFTVPFFAAVLSLLLGMTAQYYLEGRQHQFIRQAFRHYVSPSLIEEIVKNPEALNLGGERRELSIFFSDIAGFTSISEKLEPARLVSLMNSFLSEMTEIIQRHNGTVDKYIGDAVVAFWNAPVPVADHAYLAVTAGLRCQEKLAELADQYQRDYGVAVKMRIGINTAFVTVGNFGSRERFSYTVIGDGVNLASRLEGSNKYFSTNLLVTAGTNNALQGRIPTRKVAAIKVVGKEEVVEVFEPYLDPLGLLKNKMLRFSEALEVFEKGELNKALEIFREISEDPVSSAYILRLERELKKGEYHSWSPVWNLTDK